MPLAALPHTHNHHPPLTGPFLLACRLSGPDLALPKAAKALPLRRHAEDSDMDAEEVSRLML